MKSIPALLSCQALRDLLRGASKKISLIEADIGKQFEKEFQHGHLPRARYFDQLECTTPSKLIPRGLPEIKCFEGYLSRLGVSNQDHIVLYDRSPMGFYGSSRAWWLLKTYGVHNLSILNGGFYKWLKEINEIESSNSDSKPSTDQSTKFQVHFDSSMVKNYEDLMAIVSSKSNKTQIVDARAPASFYGANAGHIPRALNVPYTDVFDQSTQSLKSVDELRKLFEKNGVDMKKQTIYTCQTGTTASTLAFVGHLLGQNSTPVYNGSFTEWQQRAPKELIAHESTSTSAA